MKNMLNMNVLNMKIWWETYYWLIIYLLYFSAYLYVSYGHSTHTSSRYQPWQLSEVYRVRTGSRGPNGSSSWSISRWYSLIMTGCDTRRHYVTSLGCDDIIGSRKKQKQYFLGITYRNDQRKAMHNLRRFEFHNRRYNVLKKMLFFILFFFYF